VPLKFVSRTLHNHHIFCESGGDDGSLLSARPMLASRVSVGGHDEACNSIFAFFVVKFSLCQEAASAVTR